MKQILVSKVKALVSEGYVRTPKSKGYLGEGKSIKEFYGLTTAQVNTLFKNEALKGLRVKRAKEEIEVVNDEAQGAVAQSSNDSVKNPF